MSNIVIPYQDITYRIIGAAMQVHRDTPRGLKEKHYQRALTAAMLQDGLIVEEEYHLEIFNEQTWLGRLYLDHWVNECIVVEDKAVSRRMGDKELAQVITYLAATQAPVGLLLNFGRSRLEYKRILPPKAVQNWQGDIEQYLWRPYQKTKEPYQ
ncbi:MAG: GxxExxY protein [Oculatellaceae cyanobacterium bins.114]|nr:GxxExxY protein [Oculatellaceae cyanobacterium bins.114]